MKALLLGAGGMLARDMAGACPDGVELVTRDHAALDVRDAAAVEAQVREHGFEWLLNCSGFTDVEAAERNRGAAFAVNADAVSGLASVCRATGAGLLHFSTDYVFDGSKAGFYDEDDAPGPLNVYGESKLAGEEAVRRSGARHLIVRTQWLFGPGKRSFAGLMYERARGRQATRVVSDEHGCCTYTMDLALAVWDVLGRAEGTLHIANRGRVSRYTIASRVFARYGVAELLSPCTSAEFGSTTRRPANSPLSLARVERLLGRQMPPWKDALDRFLVDRERSDKGN